MLQIMYLSNKCSFELATLQGILKMYKDFHKLLTCTADFKNKCFLSTKTVY